MAKNKEPEQSEASHAQQKSPYVRYRIFSDDSRDVGVGIAVKRAIDSFINNHGYEGKVTVGEKTSNRFSMVLQIFEGGNPDLLINALRDHITKSGRLPTNQSYKPTINIEPIPCNGGVQVVQESADHLAFQKEREGYVKKIDEKEDDIANLTRAIGARQRVIDEQSSRLKTLESALKCSSATEYTNPFDLLAHTYLPKSIDDLIEATDDYETLLKSENESFFVSPAQEGEISFLTYLDKRYGLKFKSKEEFEKWRKKMSSSKTWDETPEARELNSSIAKINADVKLYEIAKSSGASEETLNFLKQSVEANKPKFLELKSSGESSSKDFEKSRKAYELIASKNPEEAYNQLMIVLGRSDARSRKQSDLPIIATTKPGTELKVLRFYLPTFDYASVLEQHLHNLIESSIVPKKDYRISQSNYDEQIRILDIESTKEKRLSLDYTKLTKDPIFNALGLKPRILAVKELE